MKLRSLVCFSFVCCGLVLLKQPIWAAPTEAKKATEYRVTYIGNAGVMISWRDKKVLIDALHFTGNPYYARISDSTRKSITAGEDPFDGIDLLLATHVHPDHFDLTSVGDCLKKDSTITFISSAQTSEFIELAYSGFRNIKTQVRVVDPNWFESQRISISEMSVTVLGMKHNAPFDKIRNSGFLIEMGELKFLHIGDAELMTENFEPYNLPEQNIDVAFIPYWYLIYSESARKLVNETIRPKHIIAIHVPPAEAEMIREETIKYYPNATVFTNPMQVKVFK